MQNKLTIKRGGIAAIKNETDEIPLAYCPRCEQAGMLNKLKPRIYTKEELDNSSWMGRKPPDAEKWIQCYECGTVILKRHARKEGRLSSEIELGSPNIHALKRRNLKQHERDRLSVENIKDKDLKRELKGGAKLISYSER